ncbi:MAG: hypothetical protein RL329_4210, partial [Bacteroidota bacterium]
VLKPSKRYMKRYTSLKINLLVAVICCRAYFGILNKRSTTVRPRIEELIIAS